MEFWGIEVKPGQTVKCEPGDERVLHLSQASLGESKKEKASENVSISVKINDQKLLLGTLSTEKCSQIQFDLVFEKDFELSHGSKNSSVFFVGYRSIYQGYESEDDFSESDEDIEIAKKSNAILGNHSKKNESGKAIAAEKAVPAKPKSKPENKEAIKAVKIVQDKDDSDEDDDDFEDDSDEDDDIIPPGDDSLTEDDDSSEDEDTPKKVVVDKKRKTNSTTKTPAPEKKAKLVTPAGNQKTGGDGKKGAHIATPYPAKQGGKPQQSPKSLGSVVCKLCSRTFTTEGALNSHKNAKHAPAPAVAK